RCVFILSLGDKRDLHSFPTRRSSDLMESLWKRQRGCNRWSPKHVKNDPGSFYLIFGHHFVSIYLFLVNCRVIKGDKFNAVAPGIDRKSTRLNSSHVAISYAVFCLKKK